MTENHSFTPQERLLEEANIVDRQAKKAGGIDDETLLVKFARALLALSEFACQLECEVYSFDLGNRQQRLQIDRLEHELAAANANRLLAEHERNEARAALSAIVPTTLIEAWKALPPFCREEGLGKLPVLSP